MFFVYFHTTESGSLFYVGKGQKHNYWDGNCEFGRAESERSRSSFWWNVRRKHGLKSFIIEEFENEKEAFYWEKFYIKLIGRRDLGTGCLTNLTDGGDGVTGCIISEESKSKRRESLKKAWAEGKFENRFTEEVKARISQNNSARIFTEKMRKGIGIGNKRLRKSYIAINRKTGEKQQFESLTELRATLKVGHKTVIQNLHKQFHFERDGNN